MDMYNISYTETSFRSAAQIHEFHVFTSYHYIDIKSLLICVFFVFLRKQKFYSPLNLNRLQFFITSGRRNSKEPINMYHLWRSEAVRNGEAFCKPHTQEFLSFAFVPEIHKIGFKGVFEWASSTLIQAKGSLSSIGQTALKYE